MWVLVFSLQNVSKNFTANIKYQDKDYATEISFKVYCLKLRLRLHYTSHSAYDATETESNGAKIDGLLPPNFM